MNRIVVRSLMFLFFTASVPEAWAEVSSSNDPNLKTIAEKKEAALSEEENNCQLAQGFSEINYEQLKEKLQEALRKKNGSITFLNFKTLQAQVDIFASHLLSSRPQNNEEAMQLTEQTLGYLTQLEVLVEKAKENATQFKKDYVIPLATLTSMRAEYDRCTGNTSSYTDIFKTISQLNTDLTNILMISPQKLIAKKKTLLKQQKELDNDAAGNLNIHLELSASLHYVQQNVRTITDTFSFDTNHLVVVKQ